MSPKGSAEDGEDCWQRAREALSASPTTLGPRALLRREAEGWRVGTPGGRGPGGQADDGGRAPLFLGEQKLRGSFQTSSK